MNTKYLSQEVLSHLIQTVVFLAMNTASGVMHDERSPLDVGGFFPLFLPVVVWAAHCLSNSDADNSTSWDLQWGSWGENYFLNSAMRNNTTDHEIHNVQINSIKLTYVVRSWISLFSRLRSEEKWHWWLKYIYTYIHIRSSCTSELSVEKPNDYFSNAGGGGILDPTALQILEDIFIKIWQLY